MYFFSSMKATFSYSLLQIFSLHDIQCSVVYSLNIDDFNLAAVS